jgi:hypothetical protein
VLTPSRLDQLCYNCAPYACNDHWSAFSDPVASDQVTEYGSHRHNDSNNHGPNRKNVFGSNCPLLLLYCNSPISHVIGLFRLFVIDSMTDRIDRPVYSGSQVRSGVFLIIRQETNQSKERLRSICTFLVALPLERLLLRDFGLCRGKHASVLVLTPGYHSRTERQCGHPNLDRHTRREELDRAFFVVVAHQGCPHTQNLQSKNHQFLPPVRRHKALSDRTTRSNKSGTN